MRARSGYLALLNGLLFTGLWTLFDYILPKLEWWPGGVPGRVAKFVLGASTFYVLWLLTRKIVYEPEGEGGKAADRAPRTSGA